MADARKQFVQLLWNVTMEMNVFYEANWTRKANDLLKNYTDEVYKVKIIDRLIARTVNVFEKNSRIVKHNSMVSIIDIKRNIRDHNLTKIKPKLLNVR